MKRQRRIWLSVLLAMLMPVATFAQELENFPDVLTIQQVLDMAVDDVPGILESKAALPEDLNRWRAMVWCRDLLTAQEPLNMRLLQII